MAVGRSSVKRNRTIDNLRGMGIILMVMGHVGFTENFDIWIHAFHMPLFFIISGYLYKKGMDFAAFTVAKARTLLIPYFVFGCLDILFAYAIGVDVEQKAALFNLFFDPVIGQVPLGGALWFLPALFWCNVLFFLMRRTLRDRCLTVSALSMLVGFASMFFVMRGIHIPMAFDDGLVGILFYGTGYLLNEKENTRFIKELLQMRGWVFLIVLVVILCLIFYNGMVNYRAGVFERPVLSYLNAVGGSLLLWNVAFYIDRLTEKHIILQEALQPIVTMGENTMAVLVTNQVLIALLARYSPALFPDSGRWFYLARMAAVLFVMLVSCVFGITVGATRFRFVIGKRMEHS